MKSWSLLGIVLLHTVGVAAADPGSPDALGELLTRLDRTAQLYSERARGFTCEETIRWDKKGKTGRRKFGYVVALDDSDNFDDYRTRLRSRKRDSPPSRVRPEDLGVPAYLRSAYLWVFLFKRDRWPFHHYQIIEETRLFDRPAVVIRFEPIPPYRETVNNWYGSAWIDLETAQPLKVVAHRPEDHEEIRKIERHRAGEAVSDWVYFVEEVSTEFNVEERGMRLPSRVELRQSNHYFMRGLNEEERTTLRVYQTYTDYRFFEVETATDFKAVGTKPR